MVRRLLGRRVRAVVLAPEPEFTYRQYAVAEPFSYGEVARFDLGDLVSKAGGRLRQDALAGVDTLRRSPSPPPGPKSTSTRSSSPWAPRAPTACRARSPTAGRRAIATSTRRSLAIDRGEISRLAFAVPASCHWSLPLYELAIMAATHLADIGDGSGAIDLITAEREPLGLFGAAASKRLRTELDRAGVRLHTGVAPARMGAAGLTLMDGSVLQCDRAIALPRLEVAPLDGVAQGPHGFISTDSRMRVAWRGRCLRRRRCLLVSDQAGRSRGPAGGRGGDGDRRGH